MHLVALLLSTLIIAAVLWDAFETVVLPRSVTRRLRLITGQPPSLLAAFVLESANRTITVAFQFVPMWLGVDEAGTGLIAAAIGISPAAGVTLALARKGRIVLWTAVGLAFWWPSVRATFQPSAEAGSGIDVRYARSGCGHSE